MADADSLERSDERHPMGQWLRERLTGPRGREDWTRVVQASWEHLSATPLRELMPPGEARAWIDLQLDSDRLEDLVRPVVRTILPALIRIYREDTAPLGRWVPDAARGGIERMVSRPGMVHEDWIRALFRQRVVEAVMADALYRGIRDFSTIMPRLMLTLMPMNRFAKLGTAGALGKRLMEELERRIEPEIKAFLKGGTKRALERAAEFAIEHRDDETARAFRKNVVQFVLQKSPQFHVHPISDELLDELAPVAEKIARHAVSREETRTLIGQVLEDIDKEYGSKPLGQVLREIGIEKDPDLEGWAAVTWPGLVHCLEADPVKDWMDGLVAELLEEHARRSSG